MRKIFFQFVVAVLLFALGLPVEAQQPAKFYRVGYLGMSRREGQQPREEAFAAGMRELGYAVGKNLVIEYRYADARMDRLSELAAGLVRLNVDVIVTGVNPGVVAAKQVTSTIPIVMTFGNDPIGTGLVASLSRPGGNITGLTVDTGDEFLGKRLELLKEAAGKLSRLAVVFNRANAAHQLYLKNLELPARHFKLTLIPVGYSANDDFEKAFKEMTTQHADGMFLFSDGVIFDQRSLITKLSIKSRLPSGYPAREYVEAGGLTSYGPDLILNMRRAATYVDKILKGAKPADLPIEQPTRFEFVINLKAAKQIGLTIPPNVLARADRVIR